MSYVIKRYSNRKLYDTQESRYVTLEELEELIRAGKEISVVDVSIDEDLTSVTLAQIILENERSRRAGWMPSTSSEGKTEKKAETPGEAEALRNEVSALREQLRALEERLEKKREK